MLEKVLSMLFREVVFDKKLGVYRCLLDKQNVSVTARVYKESEETECLRVVFQEEPHASVDLCHNRKKHIVCVEWRWAKGETMEWTRVISDEEFHLPLEGTVFASNGTVLYRFVFQYDTERCALEHIAVYDNTGSLVGFVDQGSEERIKMELLKARNAFDKIFASLLISPAYWLDKTFRDREELFNLAHPPTEETKKGH